ncbi:DUF221-domain-containing protein [Lindgomyces ingoldianus]|uniref:DUF221-domain-containing protein n=1 Tax=Lindgomyces ingoldianus TaxID=673940 RepID=A0ACB6RD45_9PLEO|nr:DUF221-domain-containing protein [Lindgomyces ingoldianus]KAF2476442.1 DUF221-domain-containing protein [Lindgomyces ingoldianus]
MSGPSSEGRPSVSSEPSATSSHTLGVRFSGSYGNNGQGSSAQRPSLAGSRNSSGSGQSAQGPVSRHVGADLEAESLEGQDFAHRRHRSRRSGGFLLDPTFPTGPRSRDRHHTDVRGGDPKGKRNVHPVHGVDSSGHQERIGVGNRGPSNTSPLSQGVVMGDRGAAEDRTRTDSANGQGHGSGELRIAKNRNSVHEFISATNGTDSSEGQPRVAIDPNQIVHMALNLSESRRRNLSAGQLIAPPNPGSTRVASVAIPPGGSFRNYGAGGSLRQYLNEQRRVSRNISPSAGRNSPSALRHLSTSMPRSASMSFYGQPFSPSESTLARRDKARAYIELRVEYLRLLEYLPPLKPDATAPGNFIVSATNMPGSPHAQLTRTPSHAGSKYELGRVYNPLQYIRNRRSRARERKALHHDPEEFLDIDKVRDWVDKVEHESQRPGYRQQDGVILPLYHNEHHQKKNGPSKPPRPRMGWVVHSEELLADAHWLEQEDNKILIEDHHGRKIFPPKEPPRQDFLQPRASKEYPEKRRRSWVEGLPRLSAELGTGDESDPTSERGRKRRLLPAFRSESPKHKKHGWRASRPQSGSFTDSSDSESGSQKRGSRKPRCVIDINNNTGPLELRMKEMIEKEAEEAKMNHSNVVSPDTPNKWGEGYPDIVNSNTARESLEMAEIPNGSALMDAAVNLKLPLNTRRTEVLFSDSAREPRSSFEDLDTTAPNTPIYSNLSPYIGADLSPPPSRAGSVSKKPKRSKLDIFRSDESTKDKKRGSRQASEEVAEGNAFGSAIFSAPGAVKNLLAHRKNDSVSSLNSPEGAQRKDKDAKDPGSAVNRFFKGVKSEGSKVGGFIFRRDRPVEYTDSESELSHPPVDESDTGEDSAKPKHKLRPSFARNNTGTTIGSMASQNNSRYHLELPSFRSSNQPDIDKAYATDSQLSDHITRQTRDRANNRSPRFDRLAPPRIDLRSISTNSSPGPSRPRSPGAGRERLNRTLERPGGVGRGGLPFTPLANPKILDHPSRQSSTSRPTLEGKRHWSITDESGNTLHRKVSTTGNTITQADIARVRALFLCSGIKAREIFRRAQEKRTCKPPAFLIRAARVANAELIPIPRKEEHVLAARMLTRTLEASTQALHSSADEFRSSSVPNLISTIRDLRFRVESELFPRVRSSGDEAVRITNDVSGTAPLAVKQVSDEIERMIRMRRRRMRWVRRVGWVLVDRLFQDSVRSFEAQNHAPLPPTSHCPNGSASLASIVSAFVPTWVTAMVFIAIFCAVRHRYPKIYAPRTYIGTISKKDHTPSASRSYFDWIHTLRVVPDKFTLYHVSLDAYLFLRFLRTAIFICVVGCCITWPVLMPINATGGGTSTELDKISIGNVTIRKRLYAHAVIAWVFFAFVMFTVARERLWLIGLRQAWSLSKSNAKRLSSRTVLFLSAPKEALEEKNLQRYFSDDAVRCWPATKGGALESLVSDRNAQVKQLEDAEMTLIRRANKKGRKGRRNNDDRNGNYTTYADLPDPLKKSSRPTHWLKTPPEVGKRVDSIEWLRGQIKEKESDIQKTRESYKIPESHGAAAVFVEFGTQAAAQRACQQIASAKLLTLDPRYIGTMPNEIIWENLTIPPARRISQEGIATGLVIATILFWSIPVAFVAAISNVTYLAENYQWLNFLKTLPKSVQGLLTGLVPPLLTSLLSKYVPSIFRYVFKSFGEPTTTSAELKVQKWYYVFQVTQVFLVTTLSSGAAAVVSQIAQNPTSVPALLAKNLPTASNFYLTYFIVQGITSSSDNLLNYSDLLQYLFFDFFVDKTPRDKYNRYTSLRGIAWGKVFPKYTNFAIIAIAYSCIAPLVLGFAAAGLIMFYISYRYMLLFTIQPKVDTKGHSYALALQQILTGIYLAELCLIGLFGIRKATGPSIMIAVLFITTVIYNAAMNRYLMPLEKYLPADLAAEPEDDSDQTPLLSSAEQGEAPHSSESHIQRLGTQARVPPKVLGPIARFFEPHIFASHRAMSVWLKDGDFDKDDVPEYKEGDLKKVYLNPVFTSQTPLIWLARDEMGVSENEVKECEEGGLKTSDQGAWVDGKGTVKWSVEDFSGIPIFKEGIRW